MLLFVSEHVPLFKHGLLEHGLESVWHDAPVLYWLHWQTNCCKEFSTQTPWFEQFAKQADKSPVYEDSTSFSWTPVLLTPKIPTTDSDESKFSEEVLAMKVFVFDIEEKNDEEDEVVVVESIVVNGWTVEIEAFKLKKRI